VATVGKVTKFTVKSKVVVLLTPPPVAVTVTGYVPGRVEELLSRVRVLEHVGVQLFEENEALAPVGKPEVKKETNWELPELRFAVMVLVVENPWVTDLSPELEREKSNSGVVAGVMVKDALASGLGLYPLLNAFALVLAVFVRVKAPL
jgi:hypothetical protein